jgi:phosphoglycolate phosphatase
MPINAILFDLDGTLLDTLHDLADAANRVLEQAGLPTHTPSAYRRFIGDGSRMLITRAIPEDHRTPDRIEDLLTRFKDDYSRHWKTATRPYPGIRDLLRELVRRGIPRAVVTNKPHAFAERCVHHFFPDIAFQTIQGQKEDVPLKPHPRPALEVARQLRVPAPECLLLGDSDVDMQTARAAGMLPVGAAWGFRPIGELIGAGAVRVVHTPQEILECLDGPPPQ